MTERGEEKSAAMAAGGLGDDRESREAAWVSTAIEALAALPRIQYRRGQRGRKERFGAGRVYELLVAVFRAYFCHAARTGIAPRLKLSARDLVRWSVELGATGLDARAASDALYAWHGVVTALGNQPRALTAEAENETWVVVRLHHIHQEKSETHTFWCEVEVDGQQAVRADRNVPSITLDQILARPREAIEAPSEDVEPPLRDAVGAVTGLLSSVVRNAGERRIRKAHRELQRGKREGWTRQQTILAVVSALVVGCGIYVAVRRYVMVDRQAAVAMSGTTPLQAWGPMRDTTPVFYEGEHVGDWDVSIPDTSTIRLRYFKRKTPKCRQHGEPMDLYSWEIRDVSGNVVLSTPPSGLPWLEAKNAGGPWPTDVDTTMTLHDGHEVVTPKMPLSPGDRVTCREIGKQEADGRPYLECTVR